jgi:signal transduction histidine kinase
VSTSATPGVERAVTRGRGAVAIAIPAITVLGMIGAAVVGRGTPQGDVLIWMPLAVSCTTVGAVLWLRRVGGALAGLFIAVGLYLPIGLLLRAVAYHDVPGAPWAAWAFQSSISISLLILLVVQLFPTGTPVSPGWRWLVWATIAGVALSVVGSGLGVTQEFVSNFPGIQHPLQLLPRSVADAITGAGNLAGGLAFLASALAMVVRFRRSTGDERLQVKEFAFAAAIAAIGFAIGIVVLPEGPDAVFALLAPLIPIAAGVSILRYRLYDIDLVISKTVVYATLAIFIGAVYAAIVVGIGLLLGTETTNPALSIAATGVVALTFQPARDRVQRLANRLVYGERATPYDVITRFSERVAGTYATEDVLPRTAHVIADGVNAERATIWLRLADEFRAAAAWPERDVEIRTARTGSVDGGELPAIHADHVAPIRYGGQLLGAIAVEKARGELLTPAEVKLVDDLAAQAGLVVSNVRLTADLEARLEVIARQATELRASRQRIVAAQDEERRRLERNIHDGAQQHLVALAVKLRLARGLVGRDPDRARTMLAEIRGQVDEALATLRSLALGIYPPLLEEQGVVAALAARYGSSDLPVRFHSDGTDRYPLDTEAAIYFCVLEALQNAAKHAAATVIDVTLSQREGALAFEVADDGAGFDATTNGDGTGLQGMRDRLAVLGGDVGISSAPGRGTVVSGRVPLATEISA